MVINPLAIEILSCKVLELDMVCLYIIPFPPISFALDLFIFWGSKKSWYSTVFFAAICYIIPISGWSETIIQPYQSSYGKAPFFHSYVSLPSRSHETKPSIRNHQALDHQLLAQTATPLRLPLTWVLGLAVGEKDRSSCDVQLRPLVETNGLYGSLRYILCQVGVAALLFLGHETNMFSYV